MRKRLLYVAPFPPEFHGQAVSSQKLLEELSEKLNGWQLDKIDTNKKLGPWSTIHRILAYTTAVSSIFFSSSRTVVYLSLNARKGMLVTLALAFLTRIKKQKLLIHHHTYSHIADYSKLFAMLAKVAGLDTMHITICPEMSAQLMARYSGRIKFSTSINNTSSVDTNLLSLGMPLHPPRKVGFLSNITREKGLLRAIEAFDLAKGRNLIDQLIIAGPIHDEDLSDSIHKAGRRHGDSIKYIGAVYGQEKQNFFESIDVFIFPSKYPNETQGIVNLEALASGRPVVAFGKCCIPSDLTNSGGLAVNENADFSNAFIGYLESRANSCDADAPRERFKELCEEHEHQINDLIDYIAQDNKCQLP